MPMGFHRGQSSIMLRPQKRPSRLSEMNKLAQGEAVTVNTAVKGDD
jgi:hypothetical protein